MGEAMPESGVFAHAKARALLEVVRLAFEGELVFDTNLADASCATPAEDADQPASTCTARHKAKPAKEYREYAPPQAHPPHRPASTGSSSRLVPGGPCMWCSVTVTPQWRRPRGTNKLLCNACGIFFTRYGRLPEKSHHAYAAAAEPAPASPLLPASSPSAGGAAAPQDAQAAPGPPEAAEQGARDPTDASHPHELKLHPKQLQPQYLPPPQPQQSQPGPGPPSSTAGISPSPHKRKHAPQPESELLRCLEGDPDSRSATFVDTAASPAPPPPPTAAPVPAPAVLHPAAAPLQLLMYPGPPALPQPYDLTQQPGAGAAAAAADDRSTPAAASLLAVTPLDLDLGLQQHFSHLQQLGLLGPAAFTGLGLLPSLCLRGPAAAAAAAAAASAAAAAAGSPTAGRALGLGYPGFPPPGQYALVPAAAAMPGLPPALLGGRQFTLPTGVLQSAPQPTATAAQSAQQPLYARPHKRQERLPAGESDDSNISTDSHAATAGDAGMSHDEDEGGTATGVAARAGGRCVSGSGWQPQRGTGSAISGAAAAAASAGPHGGGLSCSPPAMPAAQFPSSLAPGGSFGGDGGGGAGPSAPLPRASAGPVAAAAEPSGGDPMELQHPPPPPPPQHPFSEHEEQPQAPSHQQQQQQEQQQQQQVILLPTRRSKGPRNRGASGSATATPTSSAQS